MTVTFSAGLMSRLTDRQALGNTIAGLYGLVPGAYLVKKFVDSDTYLYIETIIGQSVAIGLGSWLGTVLCSPWCLERSVALKKSSSIHGAGPVLFF